MTDQRLTIATPMSLSGVGLHLGHECRITFCPAPRDAGVAFVRLDRPGAPRIPALAGEAVLTERRTQLGQGIDAVHTVEHVLAAVAATGVDDLTIEMTAPEPPIMDGSARPFFDALAAAGLVTVGGTAQYLEIEESVEVVDGGSRYEAHPSSGFELDITIDFPHPLIGRQWGRYRVTREAFGRELAAARTFGFLREVDALRAMGLIRGASIDNAIVLDETAIIGDGLRWPDEFVRHKALDCVGDLALAGRRIRARIIAERPSHRGTVLLVRELTRTPSRR